MPLLLALFRPAAAMVALATLALAQQTPNPDTGEIKQRAFGPVPPVIDASLTLIIRIRPSFHPDEELRIWLTDDAKPFRVDWLQARRQLEEFLPTRHAGEPDPPFPDVETLIRQMDVVRKTAELPAAVGRRWLAGFRSAVNASVPAITRPSRLIQLDGTQYSVTAETWLYSLHVVLSGSELGEDTSRDLQLIQWIDRVRRDVKARLK